MKTLFKCFFSSASLLTLLLFVFSACSDKDYYDPDSKTEYPLSDITVPADFDWRMTTTAKVNVSVQDEFDGKYNYLIEVFDNNPIISSDAKLITAGVARKGQSLSTEINLPKAIQTVYIRQTMPTGLSVVRAEEVTNGQINCNFGSTAVRNTSRGIASRAFVEATAPDHNDTAIFPTERPADAEEFVQGSFQSGKSYYVTAKTTRIDLGNDNNISLYVTENIELSELYLTLGSKLFVLPGKSVESSTSLTRLGQSNCLITIGANAQFIVNGTLQLSSDYKFFNLGTIEASELKCDNSSFFYNGGTATFKTKASAQNGESVIMNDGDMQASDFTLAGGSHAVNNGHMIVSNITESTSSNGSWENNGTWETRILEVRGWNDYSLNSCKLIVFDKISLSEARLIVDGGAYVETKELEMNNTKIELGTKAFFHVTEKATYNYQTKDRGFWGTGSDKAILKINKATAKNPQASNIIHYTGNLQIICDDHPDAQIDPWNIRWTLNDGAEWVKEGENTVEIEQSECNEGIETNPGEPTNPTIPPLENGFTYTFLFEDEWPVYGDYDMNDVVFKVSKITTYPNTENKTEKMSFEFTVLATGAMKRIAGAVMLDKLNTQSVQSVQYSQHAPKLFDVQTNGVEANSGTSTIIPLFDEAHTLLGVPNAWNINTIPKDASNGDPVTFIVTIEFTTPQPIEYCVIEHLNFFIITDVQTIHVSSSARKEIHVIGHKPTSKANTTYFGNHNDNSVNGPYYSSKDNLAWGIMIPDEYRWTQEKVDIQDAYPDFKKWISGEGKDLLWWNNPMESKLFYY